MQKLLGVIVAAGIAAAAWTFVHLFEVKGLENISVVARDELTDGPLPARNIHGDSIRVAAFNIQVFGPSKAGKPNVMHALAKIIRQFDVVAIQEIRTKDRNLLYQLQDQVNLDGARYEIVAGPRLGRTVSKEQFAYIFDTERIEMDRYQLYTVRDPEDVIHREPLVGWFRVRGPDPKEAFTFTLINVHTDPDEAKEEVAALNYLFDEVRNDGRGEDDVIMLGDFNADGKTIQALGGEALTAPIQTMTNTRGTKQYDNVLFDERATVEFNGRAGVYDFLREFNLTIDEALQVSDHLPVWAEFSIYEGGRRARLAERPDAATR